MVDFNWEFDAPRWHDFEEPDVPCDSWFDKSKSLENNPRRTSRLPLKRNRSASAITGAQKNTFGSYVEVASKANSRIPKRKPSQNSIFWDHLKINEQAETPEPIKV